MVQFIKKKQSLYSTLIFICVLFISSCSNDNNRLYEEKMDKLIINQIEIERIHDEFLSNDYPSDSIFRYGELEFSQIKNYFDDINLILKQSESIINSPAVNDDDLTALETGFYFYRFLAEPYSYLYDIGYLLWRPEDNFNPEYEKFFLEYTSIFNRMIDSDQFITSPLNVIFNAVNAFEIYNKSKIKFDLDRKKWYELIFTLYEQEPSLVEDEIDEFAYTSYFTFFSDYLFYKNDDDGFTISIPKSRLTNTYNIISKKVLRRLDSDDFILLFPTSNFFYWSEDYDKDVTRNFIYYNGFYNNANVALEYSDRGYFKESDNYLDKSIDYFNKIEFDKIEQLLSDDVDMIVFLSSVHATLYDLIHHTLLSNSYNFSELESQEAFNAYYLDKYNDIENFESLQGLSDKVYDLNLFEEFDFSEDSATLIKYNIHGIIHYVNEFQKKAIEGEINPYEKLGNWDIRNFAPENIEDENDASAWKFFIEATRDSIFYELIYGDKYKDLFIKYDYNLENIPVDDYDEVFNNYPDLEEDWMSTYEEYSLLYKRAFNRIISDININDIKDNPEEFSTQLSIIKDAIISESIPFIIEVDYSKYGDLEQTFTHLQSIILLEKINKLYRSELKDISIYEYLFKDIEIDVAKQIKVFDETFKGFEMDMVFTSFSENKNSVDNFAIFHIKKSSDSEKRVSFDIDFITYDKPNDKEIYTIDRLTYKLNKLNTLISYKADVSELQKEIYNALFGLIDENINNNSLNIIILDPLIENLPIESLIDKNDNYLFEAAPWIRARSIYDFYKDTNTFANQINSIEQNIDTFQRFIGLTDDIVTPNILALGGIDYDKNVEFYDLSRSGERLGNLPWTEVEIKNIKHRFRKNKVLKGFRASETFVKNENLNKYDIIHFATHGIMFYEQYQNSSLMLSKDDKNDGLLTYNEIKNLDLSGVDVVFMSACNTNFARPFKNLTIPSLQQAFKDSGARSVVSTLWLIDDKATSLFVDIYYDQYLKIGSSSYALNEARKIFIEQYPEYSHPYYWAGFAHFGI